MSHQQTAMDQLHTVSILNATVQERKQSSVREMDLKGEPALEVMKCVGLMVHVRVVSDVFSEDRNIFEQC